MKRVLLLLLLAGCPSETIDEVTAVCGDREAEAVNPFSGECVTFASPCDVPVEWSPCDASDLRCGSDDDCVATQHCAAVADAGEPTCADNPVCHGDDCDAPGYVCDLAAREDQDPSLPEGLCARPDAGAPPEPTDGTCVVNSQCSELEICPAQYGGCSEADDRDVSCPSRCEPACLADEECLAVGEICNAGEICGEANGAGESPPLVCSGWCVPG